MKNRPKLKQSVEKNQHNCQHSEKLLKPQVASYLIDPYYLQTHDKLILSKDSDLSYHRSTFGPNKKVVEISIFGI